MATYQK